MNGIAEDARTKTAADESLPRYDVLPISSLSSPKEWQGDSPFIGGAPRCPPVFITLGWGLDGSALMDVDSRGLPWRQVDICTNL
jgi:hypothetical protein